MSTTMMEVKARMPRARLGQLFTTAGAVAYAAQAGYPITASALLHAIRDQRLPARRAGLGNRPDWLIARRDLDRYLAARRTGTGPDGPVYRRPPGPAPSDRANGLGDGGGQRGGQ